MSYCACWWRFTATPVAVRYCWTNQGSVCTRRIKHASRDGCGTTANARRSTSYLIAPSSCWTAAWRACTTAHAPGRRSHHDTRRSTSCSWRCMITTNFCRPLCAISSSPPAFCFWRVWLTAGLYLPCEQPAAPMKLGLHAVGTWSRWAVARNWRSYRASVISSAFRGQSCWTGMLWLQELARPPGSM